MTLAIEEPLAWLYTRRLSVVFLTVGANILTQILLWHILTRYFQHYLQALVLAEALIWSLEALCLCLLLPTRRAVLLSCLMNASSLAAGWFLPV